MPKMIDNARENILSATRDILLNSGYCEITMRDVAEKSGVAIGTLYNYFPSKKYLAANAILDDWYEISSGLSESMKTCSSPEEGFTEIYAELKRFIAAYSDSWRQYDTRYNARNEIQKYHPEMRRQIAELICSVLVRFLDSFPEKLPDFLAEVILSISMSDDNLDDYLPIIKKLLY